MPEILLRPDLGKRPYRLRCRFRVEAYPAVSFLEKAKYAAAEQFVQDMAKQGWQYVGKHGFTMKGPFPATQTVTVPQRRQQARWHIPSRDLLAAVQAGYRFDRSAEDGGYVQSVPLLGETDKWEFELAGVFIHDTILTEYPDEHEVKEEMAKR